jgi:hypothetical protein
MKTTENIHEINNVTLVIGGKGKTGRRVAATGLWKAAT